MASLQARLRRIENERRFWRWFHFQRFLEGLTVEELKTYARHGRLPEPLPEPLPKGMSRLDRLDRKSLVKLWEENERIYRPRSQEDLKFFVENGYWPEQQLRPHYYLEEDGRWAVGWRIHSAGEKRQRKH